MSSLTSSLAGAIPSGVTEGDVGATPLSAFPPSDPNDDNGPKAAIIIWLLFGLSGLFLWLRIYAKVSRHRGLWWDDHVLIASWVSLSIDLAFITKMITKGYGKHADQIDPEVFSSMAVWGSTSGIFAIAAVAWSKTSFALTILRISEGWVKWLIWFIIISMNIALSLTPILHWTACRPISKMWNPLEDGTCIDPQVLVHYDIFSATYSAFMDFFLAFLPAYLVKDLQMRRREKIGIAVAMSMGVCAGSTAIVKSVYLPALADEDFSYAGVELVIWGTAEISTTIIAASIPVLRVFLRDVKSSMEKYYRTPGLSGNETNAKRSRAGTVLRSGNNTMVQAGGDTERANVSGYHKDDDSDKSILAHGRIVQTNEVAIEYHNRGDGDAMSYEMGRMEPEPYQQQNPYKRT